MIWVGPIASNVVERTYPLTCHCQRTLQVRVASAATHRVPTLAEQQRDYVAVQRPSCAPCKLLLRPMHSPSRELLTAATLKRRVLGTESEHSDAGALRLTSMQQTSRRGKLRSSRSSCTPLLMGVRDEALITRPSTASSTVAGARCRPLQISMSALPATASPRQLQTAGFGPLRSNSGDSTSPQWLRRCTTPRETLVGNACAATAAEA